MINNSEDKYIQFTLEKPCERYDAHKTYYTGDCVWYNDKYWLMTSVTPVTASTPTESNSNWTSQATIPVYDTTNIDGMVIIVYFKGSNKVVEKYSLNASAGYKGIDATNAASGIYVIELPASVTKNTKEGVLLAEIKIRENIAGYTGTDFNTIIPDILIAEVNRPLTEFIDVP